MRPTDVVATHPRIAYLGRTPAEQGRLAQFAREIAAWLVGDDPPLGPLASVVTRVARRELADASVLCRGRPPLAIEAAARGVEALWPWLRDQLEAPPEPPPEPDDPSAPDDGEGDADSDAGEGDGPEGTSPGASIQRPGGEGTDTTGSEPGSGRTGPPDDLSEALATAATDGVLAASRTERALESLLPGLGSTLATGRLHRAVIGDLQRLASLIEQLPQLRAIAEELGRIEDSSRRDGHREGGSEEVAGVRRGGDVSRALPAELGLLGDPDLEGLFHARWLERQLLSLELRGGGMDGRGAGTRRGPVIAVIDTSGSMRGAPEAGAKALILAVARRLFPQRRTLHIVLFSGPGDLAELRLKHGAAGLEPLLDFLALRFSGGTDFDTPLRRCIALVDERELRDADVLIVTDGYGRVNHHVVADINALRAEAGLRVRSVVLGDLDRFVRPFSDDVWLLDAAASVPILEVVRQLQQRSDS